MLRTKRQAGDKDEPMMDSGQPIRSSGHAVSDVLVIGAGQAGLALAYYAKMRGLSVQMLEAAAEVGHSWRRRWDSLRLFTPVRYNTLGLLPFPGEQWAHPTKDEVADYLAQFSEQHNLTVAHQQRVTALDGQFPQFVATTEQGQQWCARQVVVATGPFGAPAIPSWALGVNAEFDHWHSDDYRRPAQLRTRGPVLIVGAGNTGVQIAIELARAGHSVHLSAGHRPRHLPQRVAGRDLFWWLSTMGILSSPVDSPVGRRMQANDPVIGTSRQAMRAAGVISRPRSISADGASIGLQDGSQIEPGTVIWATGYRHDDRWIRTQGALDGAGALTATGGIARVRGLYTIGRSWQRSRGSALLGFVAEDARDLARRIATAPRG